MSTLTAVRTALKTTLQAALPSDMFVYDVIPDAVQLPCVLIKPSGIDFAVTFGRGTDTMTFDLEVLVPWDDPELAQVRLDTFVTGSGSASVRQVIYQTPRLGLTDTHAFVSGMSSYGTQNDVAGVQHLGAVLELVIRTSGTA